MLDKDAPSRCNEGEGLIWVARSSLLLFRRLGICLGNRPPSERAAPERGGDAMRYANTSLRAPPRAAITLIELLVAIAATLVLMTAVTGVINILSGGMADNCATIELMDQLRTVRQNQLDAAVKFV